MMQKYILMFLGMLWISAAQGALVPGENDLYIRIVDVGPGLCTITRAPGPGFMVYDAGHWNNRRCHEAAVEVIGDNDIDLMVISHNDGDHLGDADLILDTFRVRKIIRTGFERRGNKGWENMNRAIGLETQTGATVINLGTEPLVPGTMLNLGAADIQAVRGYNRWPHEQGHLSKAELRNVISIVLRLTYNNQSVLFTGDTVGRDMHLGTAEQCKYAEKLMVDEAADVPISAQVIIAPHHGSETSGSTCFLNAVGADFAIFSAGHTFSHPRVDAMNRYLDAGVIASRVYRTDRGDDEGSKESDLQRVPGCKDRSGDDDIEIVIRQDGAIEVDYRLPAVPCGN
jgi:beta-lactamase superfamily II metal-dependent hydrolase